MKEIWLASYNYMVCHCMLECIPLSCSGQLYYRISGNFRVVKFGRVLAACWPPVAACWPSVPCGRVLAVCVAAPWPPRPHAANTRPHARPTRGHTRPRRGHTRPTRGHTRPRPRPHAAPGVRGGQGAATRGQGRRLTRPLASARGGQGAATRGQGRRLTRPLAAAAANPSRPPYLWYFRTRSHEETQQQWDRKIHLTSTYPLP